MTDNSYHMSADEVAENLEAPCVYCENVDNCEIRTVSMVDSCKKYSAYIIARSVMGMLAGKVRRMAKEQAEEDISEAIEHAKETE